MKRLTETLSMLGLFALGGVFTMIIADIYNGTVALYCLGIAGVCFAVVFPYYLIGKRRAKRNRGHKLC